MTKIDSLKDYVKQKMKNDSAHDFNHIMRVYKNAKTICKTEKVNDELVLSGVLLHDVISYPKSHKDSKLSSVKSSKKAKTILKKYGYSEKEIKIISDAIKDHSFSRHKTPQTIEGKILQDADRLDAIGAIGIARVFAVGGAEKRPFYDPDDPFCKKRKPNDQTWTLDHFYQKLLCLERLMNTKSGKKEAKRRTKILKNYLLELKQEI